MVPSLLDQLVWAHVFEHQASGLSVMKVPIIGVVAELARSDNEFHTFPPGVAMWKEVVRDKLTQFSNDLVPSSPQ
jgi:hypothetical protein